MPVLSAIEQALPVLASVGAASLLTAVVPARYFGFFAGFFNLLAANVWHARNAPDHTTGATELNRRLAEEHAIYQARFASAKQKGGET
jgi:hypothetical protein